MTYPTRRCRAAIALAAIAFPFASYAKELCEFSVDDAEKNSAGVRIASIACAEHALWRKPFINAQGRIVRIGPMEGERDMLADGRTSAWRRVLHYWQDTGLLDGNARWEKGQVAQNGDTKRNGASDCAGNTQDWGGKAACRAFLLDVPWSAVFVSYAMKKAEVPEFVFSSSHYYYIRDAAKRPETGPYRLADPLKEKPDVGDLLCYLREKNRVHGYSGLIEILNNAGRPFDSHCDIVVGVDLHGDSKLYTIGGNVVHSVTMRKLNLNARGLLSLQMKKEGDDTTIFDVGREKEFGFNRQDWAALLKLNR